MSQQGDEKIESTLSLFDDEENPDTTDVGPFMRRLFEKQLYTDVTFRSSDKKEFITAHRVVLAAKSDFFDNLLFGDQKRQAIDMEMQVEISNVPFSVFRNIVKYFYTDDIEFTDNYTVFEIYSAAQSFRIVDLVDRSKIHLESIDIREDNVCSTLQVCNVKNVEELKRRCLSYIRKNTVKVMSSSDFEKCSFATIHEICELEDLNTCEEELLEGVVRWVNCQPKHSREELKRSLLKCVRFLVFTQKRFCEVLQKHTDLMTPEEGLKILMYLSNPTPETLKALPEWCNKYQRSFPVEKTKLHKVLPQQCLIERRIDILLIPTKEAQDVTELKSLLLMDCLKGEHHIKSIKFSFDVIKDDGGLLADLVIKTCVKPNVSHFVKHHTVNSSGRLFVFPENIIVSKGQKLVIEISAKISQSCKFLQFQRLCNNPSKDFYCWIESKPHKRKLNFISKVEYQPVPHVNSE